MDLSDEQCTHISQPQPFPVNQDVSQKYKIKTNQKRTSPDIFVANVTPMTRVSS